LSDFSLGKLVKKLKPFTSSKAEIIDFIYIRGALCHFERFNYTFTFVKHHAILGNAKWVDLAIFFPILAKKNRN